MKKEICTVCLCAAVFAACREENVIPPLEVTLSSAGFYVLNEGQKDQNNATLDFYDRVSARYLRDIYQTVNPSVPMALGDVGNDLKIYGSRLYAVINESGKVEVMRAASGERIGKIDVPNCRHIAFYGGYAYVTSFAVHSSGGGSYVAKIDTATMSVVAQCVVGMQPEGIAVSGGKLYVANTNGYAYPDYDSTLSVIDIASFTETHRITVAPNPNGVTADSRGTVWVCTNGNYADVPSRLYYIDPQDNAAHGMDIPASAVSIVGDSLYYCATEYDEQWNVTASYGIVNTLSKTKVSGNFITDGTHTQIDVPYGIEADPVAGEIYICSADASYTLPGKVFCYGKDGRQKWQETAGVNPAKIAILPYK